jgi:hypothetical protein
MTNRVTLDDIRETAKAIRSEYAATTPTGAGVGRGAALLTEARDDYDFKSFKDPWAVMPPEDRKEANRLFRLAMKAFPSSPKQLKLNAALGVLLKKYDIGI